jgi:hypothetical protein
MSYEADNFEQVRRLVAIKRYEQPPPGYFNSFSREINARLKAGERGAEATFLGRLFANINWLQSFWASLESRPIVAGAVGVAACAFLLGGIVYSTESTYNEPQAYITSPAVEGGLGLSRREASRGSVFEPPTLAGFQMSNNFGNLAAQSSLFPVQPVNFLVQGN